MADFTEFGKLELEGWSDKTTARAYAEGFATASDQSASALVQAVHAGPNNSALDICCGHGVVAKELSDTGATVEGLDFSSAMLELAKIKAPKANFTQGDATNLPYADDSFDAATMGFGILHIPNSAQALKEAKRVLVPGGRFAFSIWQGPEVSMAFRIVFDAIQKHGDPDITLPPGPLTHEYADQKHATSALHSAGFTDVSLTTVNSYWQTNSASAPYEYFIQGTVRGAILLRTQPASNQLAIKNAIADAVKLELGAIGPWKIPIPAAILSATA